MISKDDVKKVAKLARLGITEKEAENFQKELSAVLEYFELIDEADVSNINPTHHSAEGLLREDKVINEKDLVVEKLIESAPEKKERYIKVKAIL